MANDPRQQPQTEIDTIALEIFSKFVAAQPTRSGEQMAIGAYRAAEQFLAVRARVRAGELQPAKVEGPQLSEASCPNQRPTHPVNLVSQRFGNLEKANRIRVWLSQNPTPEKDEGELVDRLNRQFPELSWDMPTINTARVLLPAYALAGSKN